MQFVAMEFMQRNAGIKIKADIKKKQPSLQSKTFTGLVLQVAIDKQLNRKTQIDKIRDQIHCMEFTAKDD